MADCKKGECAFLILDIIDHTNQMHTVTMITLSGFHWSITFIVEFHFSENAMQGFVRHFEDNSLHFNISFKINNLLLISIFTEVGFTKS
jgi:hypothetical protein